jgi:hypothetical protein
MLSVLSVPYQLLERFFQHNNTVIMAWQIDQFEGATENVVRLWKLMGIN